MLKIKILIHVPSKLISLTVAWVFGYHIVRDLAYFIFTSALKARIDGKYFTGEVEREVI